MTDGRPARRAAENEESKRGHAALEHVGDLARREVVERVQREIATFVAVRAVENDRV